MKLKNFLIVVSDINRSLDFYRELFGLQMVVDLDGNMILTDGLVLQDASIWQRFTDLPVQQKSNSCELYFEHADIDEFIARLEAYYPEVEYVNRKMTHSWGQTVVRFFDYDGNLIEVGTPV